MLFDDGKIAGRVREKLDDEIRAGLAELKEMLR